MQSRQEPDAVEASAAMASTAEAAMRTEAQPALGVRAHLFLSFLWFGLNFQSSALLPIVLPTQLLLLVAPGALGSAQQATFLGWFSALGALIALLIPPLTGALSDRTAGTLGRRRPYIAVGALLLLAGVPFLALPRGIAILLVGFVLFQLGNNISTAGYQGLLPDLVPASERGAASGYMGLMTMLGNAASFILAGLLLGQVTSATGSAAAIWHGSALYYLLTGLLLAAGTAVTLAGVHETPSPPEAMADPAGHMEARSLRRLAGRWMARWVGPLRAANYRWVFLTRCFVMLGLTLFLTFIEYYFANVAHIPNFVQMTVVLALLALLGALASALWLGVLSDRIGRVPLVCGSSACMAAAALAFFVLPPTVPLWPLGLLFGVGYGAYTSVDWALAVDALPERAAIGKDMGIWSIASTLPAVVAPLVGSVAIGLAARAGQTALGYRMVFALALLSLLAGAGCILFVRESTPEGPGGPDGPSGDATGGQPARAIGRAWRLAGGAGGGHARGFLRFWRLYERISLALLRPRPIPGAPSGIFLVRFARYHGRPITLPDGTPVRRGDRIVELHLLNATVPQVASSASAFALVREMAADLGALATWSHMPDFPGDARALYGLTLLGRAAGRLGFTVRERPRTLMARLDRLFMTGLLALYSPEGLARLRRGTTYGSFPMEVWMSRAELVRRYGAPGGDQPARP
jgi:MFS family permease